MNTAHPQTIKPSKKIKQGMESFRKIQEETLLSQNISPKSVPLRFAEYAKYILAEGSDQDKKEVVQVFGKQLYIHNKEICSTPIKRR